MNEIKLKVSVDGADAAKKAVEDVNDAVNKSADAEKQASAARVAAAIQARKAAQAAAEEARRAREAVGAVDAQIAAEKKLAVAKVEAAAAAARRAKEEEAERATAAALEKQAERTAKAVERMAVSKGKSPEVAEEMAGYAKGRVLEGAAPTKVLWGVRSGLAAEDQAMKEIAASTAPAAAGMEQVGGAVASAATKTQGLVSAGRLLANAFLPDMWVARTLSAGRALIGLLSGMSAGALGLMGIVAVPVVAAFVALRKVWKEDEEAGEKLNKTIEASNRLAEQSADRHDKLNRSLGPAYFEAKRANEEAALAAERYVGTLRQAADESDRLYDSEQKRIALNERGEKASIRAEYASKLAEIRRGEIALRGEETASDLAFSKKLRDAKSPEEARSLESQREVAKAGFRERAEALRSQAGLLEGERDDRLAVAERKAAEVQAVAALKHSTEQAAIAAKLAAEAATAHMNATTELDRLAKSVSALNDEFRSSKGLSAHAGVLNMADEKTRLDHLNGLVETRTKAAETAKELDGKIKSLGDERGVWTKASEFVDDNFFGGEDSRDRLAKLARLQAERDHLGNPAADLALLKSLIKGEGDWKAARGDEAKAAKGEYDQGTKAKAAAEQAKRDKETLDIVRSESSTSAIDRKVGGEARVASAGDSAALRAERAKSREDYLSRSAGLARTMWRDTNDSSPALGADQAQFDKILSDLLPALRNVADPEKNNGASWSRSIELMQEVAGILKHHSGESAWVREKLALIERDVAAAKNLSEQNSSQLRNAR